MCDRMCLDFIRSSLADEDLSGKSVLEVGSLDVNGSARTVLAPRNPARYIGVDISDGPGVDVVCKAEDLLAQFGRESFDIVISTEMLEHVLDWQKVVSNLKGVVKPGGRLIITTRRIGMPYHGYPHDFWRFEREDFDVIFSDLDVQILETDDRSHGIFLRAARPEKFVENNLRAHKLFSILSGKRALRLPEWEIWLLSNGRRLGDAIYPSIGRYRNMLPDRLQKLVKKVFVRHYGE